MPALEMRRGFGRTCRRRKMMTPAPVDGRSFLAFWLFRGPYWRWRPVTKFPVVVDLTVLCGFNCLVR